MNKINKVYNLVLSGGGVKGIAYSGVSEAVEKRGYTFSNIAGVSAGAIAGSFIGAGYNAADLREILGSLDFGKIKMEDIPKLVSAVASFETWRSLNRKDNYSAVEFLSTKNPRGMFIPEYDYGDHDVNFRGDIIKNVALYSKEGCLFDGDYLEEWLYKHLRQKGITTFEDFRGGEVDCCNPKGYRVRFLAVDATRRKALVLPDDIEFYNINPDKLEVAKAVRMSASVPFAFKAVEIYVGTGKLRKTYSIVDGGVFDNYPIWMIGDDNKYRTIGFSLDGDYKKKFFSLDTPLSVLKSLISAVHDIGIPKTKNYENKILSKISTGNVSSLDFSLAEEDKEYLYIQGKNAALDLINKIEYTARIRNARFRRYPFFFR
ncbi:MAG TPA: patatin-like phospholipase family protein [Pseudobacteroides sp.]|uniref:patatin-like phospholipase family protein n=1 Tax=Pseudobacteroides sp. TaxID=1968840 RepID=UPI002F95A51A